MISRFEILKPMTRRPDAERILFCDGTGGSLYSAETDLELSHWRPNRTPAEYRAGTSTEICFRFLENPRPGTWTAAVNNHVDVDGILSIYVLIHSGHALQHRRAIVEAAEMGDFWGWGEPPAQRVFQGITRLMRLEREPRAIYEEAFDILPGLIDGSDPRATEIDDSLAPLREGIELVEQGQISRTLRTDRFAQYIVPLTAAGADDARACYAPQFNEAISDKAVLWPQARACWDAERICLVSVERSSGWLHDLCFPGYLWADTEGKWLPRGLSYHDGMSSYELTDGRLIAAVETLQRQETAAGRWGLGGTSLPGGDSLQELFPVVGRFIDPHGHPAVSRLSPEQVANTLDDVYV